MYSKSFSVLLIGAQCVNIHREKLSINTVDLQKLFTDRSRPVYLQSALRSGSFYLVLLGCALGDVMPWTVSCSHCSSSFSHSRQASYYRALETAAKFNFAEHVAGSSIIQMCSPSPKVKCRFLYQRYALASQCYTSSSSSCPAITQPI